MLRLGRNRIQLGLTKHCFKHFHETQYDVAIVGGGVIGTAIAQEIMKRTPTLKCVLIEKEKKLASHQSGHNSGVIHAGIYYEPGSLKAALCVRGMNLLYKYCNQFSVPYKKVGKVIVATQPGDVSSLHGLYSRGRENNVPGLTLINPDELKEIEPHCKGLGALHSSETGIIDYNCLAHAYAKYFEARGGVLVLNYKVSKLLFSGADLDFPLRITGEHRPDISCRYVITCGGLFADRLAAMTSCDKHPVIVPFRGDYWSLKPHKQHLVKGNIYPIPNPQFPFLGVHFTPRMDGSVWIGPNAVLSLDRKGYGALDINMQDTFDIFTYSGFWNLMRKHWKFAVKEFYNGFSKRSTVENVRQFIPELSADDIVRGPSGIRAQALNADGSLVDGLLIDHGRGEVENRCIHVRNAPSPAATSSLAIAEMVIDKFFELFADREILK